MPLTVEQTQLAETIDTHVRQVLAHGGGDEALLLSLADYMPTFKQLLDTCTGAEMDFCSATGMTALPLLAQLLEMLALRALLMDSIPVPE